MNVLCVCAAGSVRSVCLAGKLKACGHDALAAGFKFNGHDTMRMLCGWADLVVVMQPAYAKELPPGFGHKVRVCDVGPDVYGKQPHTNPDLVRKVKEWISKEGLGK